MLVCDSSVPRGTLHVEWGNLVVNGSDILTADSESGGIQHGTVNHSSKEDRAGSNSNSTRSPPPPLLMPMPKKLSGMRFSSQELLRMSLPISPIRSSCHPAAEINHRKEQAQKILGSRTSYRKISRSGNQVYTVVGCSDGTRRRPAMIRGGSKHDDAAIAPGFDSLLLSSPRRSPPEISSTSSSSRIKPYRLGSRRGIRSSSLWGSSLSPTTTVSGPEKCIRSLEYIMRYADASCPRVSTQLLTGFPETSNPPPSTEPQRRVSNAIQQPRAKCGCRGFTIQVNSGSIGISFEVSYRVNGIVIRRTWSDLGGSSSYSSGMSCRDSVQVHCLERSDRGNDERDILGREGRLAWSGLIKVAAVASSYHITMGRLASHADEMNMRPQEADGSSSNIYEGVLDVEEGDILVRVDDVQVPQELWGVCCMIAGGRKSGAQQENFRE